MGGVYNLSASYGTVNAWLCCCMATILASVMVSWSFGLVNYDKEGKLQSGPGEVGKSKQRVMIGLIAASSLLCLGVACVALISSSKNVAAGYGAMSFASALTSPFTSN